MTIARRIREARQKKGLSQADLARAVGVTRSAVHLWEKERSAGGQWPARKYIPKLADVLGLHPTALEPFSGDSVTPILQTSLAVSVPVLEWDEIEAWAGGQLNMAADIDRSWIQVDSSISKSSIALKIKDDSMSPAFKIGDDIIINPEWSPEPNECVLVKIHKTGQKLFRYYIPRRGTAYDLVAENPEWPTITVNASNPAQILGVLSEHHRKMRR